MVKVKITTNTKEGKAVKTVYQVELLVDIDDTHKIGDLGGWVQSIDNLKNPDTGEIEGVVLDDAEITCDARVYNNGIVKDKARLKGESIVRGNAIVGGTTIVHDTSIVEGNAIIESNCLILENSHLLGDIHIIADRTFKNVILTESPNQVEGSVDNVMLIGDILSIGCVKRPLDYWKKNIREIGLKHNYTEEQIAEYVNYLNGLLPDQ